ncbi:MAG: hypothetical protein RR555_01500 [Bacteroidales bacterium]
MKKIKNLALILVAILFSSAAMAQGTSLSMVDATHPNLLQSNFVKLAESAGAYTQLLSDEVGIMKLGSTKTLGGYTIRCEKLTDMATGKSAKAVKLIPNSATGFGKIVSNATGIGSASQCYYIDFEEVSVLLATIEKMKKACETEPTVNTTYTYVCRGGFTLSLGYVVNAKKAIKLGQISQAGEVPFIDFLEEIARSFKAAQDGFANLK